MHPRPPAPEAAGTPRVVIVFASAIALGAFLLFLVQPLMAKYILPWYGGTPAVWTTCMLFFQSFVLLGYAYAHVLSRWCAPRTQAVVHVALLSLSLLFLPVIPSDAWRPGAGTSPVWSILVLLGATLGLPYALLAATSPLLQRWYALLVPGRVPYRYFALSNIGSFCALLAYPFLVEPFLPRPVQAVSWSWGMAAYALLCSACAVLLYRVAPERPAVIAAAPTPRAVRSLWLALPAAGSVLLLAVTNKLCQDIAVVPFLWVLPLLLYLLTFVVAFDRPGWYVRPLFAALFIVACAVVSWLPFRAGDPPVALSLAGHLVLLFAGCMLCHGELYRLRPAPEGITGYYLTIALAGAIGGVFVVLVAPMLFSDYSELAVGVALGAGCVLAAMVRDRTGARARAFPRWAWIGAGALIVAYVSLYGVARSREHRFTIENTRNFYGTLKVAEYDAARPNAVHRTMRHGAILHGLQYLAPRYASRPTAYYSEQSGVGYLLRYYPVRAGRRIGVVGLGVGTLAAWGTPGDTMRFYEINPTVTDLAGRHFTYLRHCRADVELVLGDARLSLEREPAQRFDVLVLDAFNSDSPPVHLLTREAFAIYARHLKPGGAIAINMTCKYLNFFPVVARLAESAGMRWAYIHDANAEDAFYRASSTWMVVSANDALMGNEEFRKVCSRPRMNYAGFPVWTDDYAPLAGILAW